MPAARAPVPRCWTLVGAAACEEELEAPAEEGSAVELEPPEVEEAVSDEDEPVELGEAL